MNVDLALCELMARAIYRDRCPVGPGWFSGDLDQDVREKYRDEAKRMLGWPLPPEEP